MLIPILRGTVDAVGGGGGEGKPFFSFSLSFSAPASTAAAAAAAAAVSEACLWYQRSLKAVPESLKMKITMLHRSFSTTGFTQ